MGLYSLELLEQKRNFSPSKVLGVLFFTCYLMFLLYWYTQTYYLNIKDIFGITRIILGYGVSDMLMKYAFQRSKTDMPSCIRISPLSVFQRNIYEILKATIDFWNIFPLILFVPLLMLFDGVGFVGWMVLLLLMISLTNCFVLRLCRKVKGFVIYSVALIVSGYYGLGFYFYKELQFIGGMWLLVQICLLCLFVYLSLKVKTYEVKMKYVSLKRLSFLSGVGMDMLSLLRLNRFRVQYIIVLYLIIMLYCDGESSLVTMKMMYLFGLLASVGLSAQNNYGIEANYWSVLETSPKGVKSLFESKFRFHFFVATIYTLCCLPAVIQSEMSVLFFVSSYMITAIFYNITQLLNYLFINRLDLWSAPVFNYQGSTLSTTFCQLVIIVLIFGISMVFDACGCQILGSVIFMVVSALSYVFREKIFDYFYLLYRRNRYSIMQRFSK